MQWFHDMKLRARLLTAFGSIVLLGFLLGGFSLWQLAAVNSKSTEIAKNWLPSVEGIQEMWARTAEVRSAQFQHVTSLTDAEMTDAESHVAARVAAFEKARDGFRKLISSPEEKALSDELDRKWAAYLAQWEPARALSRANRNAEASAALRGDGARLYGEMNETLMKLVKLNHDSADAASTQGDAAYATSKLLIAGIAVVSLLLGAAIAITTATRITAVVTTLSRTATSVHEKCVTTSRYAIEALSLGDTTVKARAGTPMIRSTARDELGDLARTFDLMIENMGALINSFSSTQDKVEALVTEAAMIADAARDGRLDVRADATRYDGSFRRLVDGLNGTMEAVAAPIDESEQVLARVAARDLSVRMTADYRGKYLAIKTAVNTAVENLDGTLLQVDAAADQVATAGTEITTAAQSLANGASEQAASLEEVSASVHMFASMAQQSASNASEARSLAASARNDTAEGTARMQRLTEAVDEIRRSSSDTAKIIKTIDEIAFQTNLLALNAAVEAARAGDAGRGFAVVAEEVRALALRAAEAARTTSALIEQGQVSASRGVALNAEVMESLTRINLQIEKVALVTAEISAATEQQVEGVEQIKMAVDQINTVTQQVAANAEESASAATELDSQAQSLRETVGGFTLSRSRETPSRAYARPATIGARRPDPRSSRAAPRDSHAPHAMAGSRAQAAVAIPFDDDDDGGVLDSF